ncbi:MAG TPA: aminoglycoside adenylyltransferase domain-containing protein [Herpetosiphonaceae bacterium]|nr:aminoglycoside adenylyltransferase domain-containing protein [Herpetosiphonaceae bacterium]
MTIRHPGTSAAPAAPSQGIPAAIRPMLEDYLALVEQARPGLLAGLYLHGSIALGAFNERLSDIDFLALLSRPCAPEDIDVLRSIHGDIGRRYRPWPMEGSYLQWPDVGALDGLLPEHPHLHNGRLALDRTQDAGDVTWWITWLLLRERGIALAGPPAPTLPIDIAWEPLLERMRHNLAAYWGGFLSRPPRMAWLLSDYGVQWVVLGALRQFYSLRERAITSKDGAGSYGLARLPPRFHPVIEEALAIRAGTNRRRGGRLRRAIAARRLLGAVIEACR